MVVGSQVVVPTADGVAAIELAGGVGTESVMKLGAASGRERVFLVKIHEKVVAWSLPGDAREASKLAVLEGGRWREQPTRKGWPTRIVQLVRHEEEELIALGEDLRMTMVWPELSMAEQEKLESDLEAALGGVEPSAEGIERLRPWKQHGIAALKSRRQGATQEQLLQITAMVKALSEGEEAPREIWMVGSSTRLVGRSRDGVAVLVMEGVGQSNRLHGASPSGPAVVYVGHDERADVLALDPAQLVDWDRTRVQRVGLREWVIEELDAGLVHFKDGRKTKLTRRTEEDFSMFYGLDSAGRYLVKTPAADGPTLVIDSRLRGPSAFVPTMAIVASEGVGWTLEDWPAQVNRDRVWSLNAGGRKMEGPREKLITTGETVFAAGEGEGKKWVTIASAKLDLPEELWGEGVMDGKAVVIEAGDRTFVFNAPGRAVVISRAGEPRVLGALTKGLDVGPVRRIWKDPAGRIVVAGTGRLGVMFVEGTIPESIQAVVGREVLKAAMEEE
jgi:hypothetical protein